MKLSNVIIATLVLASLSGVAQEKPKESDKPKVKTSTKKHTGRIAKKDSIKRAEPNPVPKNEHWNCPPCGMG